MVATPNILDAFELFPHLPKELQLKIWSHSVPGPRIIETDSGAQQPHPILHTCHESRTEALRVLRLSLFTYQKEPYLAFRDDTARSFVQWNPATDILYFQRPSQSARAFVAYICASDRQRVRYVAFDLSNWLPSLESEQPLEMDAVDEDILGNFPNLDRLLFFAVDGNVNGNFGRADIGGPRQYDARILHFTAASSFSTTGCYQTKDFWSCDDAPSGPPEFDCDAWMHRLRFAQEGGALPKDFNVPRIEVVIPTTLIPGEIPHFQRYLDEGKGVV